MKFYFNGPLDFGSVEGVPIPMSATMPAGVAWAAWNGAQGVSIPSSGMLLQTTFTDPSPYQPLLVTWCTTQAAADPALTAAQAQALWNDLTAAIYDFQRTLPIAATFNDTNYNWDCSDEALAAMNLMLSNATAQSGLPTGLTNLATSVNTQTNGVLTDLATKIGAAFAIIWSGINAIIGSATNTFDTSGFNTTSETWTSTTPETINEAFAAVGPSSGLEPAGAAWSGPTTYVPQLSGSAPTVTPEEVDVVALGLDAMLPSFSLIPVGATAPVSLTPTQFTDLIEGINVRRAALDQRRRTLLSQIANAATVAAVVAIDCTTGW